MQAQRIQYSSKTAGTSKANRGNIAILTNPLGLLLALLLLPSDPTEPSALLWSAWALTAGILGGLVGDVLSRGITNILKAEDVLMIGILVVGYGELLQPGYVS